MCVFHLGACVCVCVCVCLGNGREDLQSESLQNFFPHKKLHFRERKGH